MRRMIAAAALGAAVLATGATAAQASGVPDVRTQPCPYAGCDTWPTPVEEMAAH